VTPQGGLADDLAFQRLVDVMFRPKHRPRRDTVDPDLGAELAGERTGQHREARLGDAVHRVTLQRPQPMDVDDVDDEPAPLGEARDCRLGEKQGCLQIGTDEVVPLRPGDFPHGGGSKARGIVDQHIHAAERSNRRVHQGLGSLGTQQVRAVHGGRTRPRPIELLCQVRGRLRRGSIMNEYARPGAVQGAGDLGADAPRASGDEDHFAVERRVACRHASERYRIVRQAGTRRSGHVL
jgi:hypothetical protein